MTSRDNTDYLAFIGTYTTGRSEGIYVHRMNGTTGALGPALDVASNDNPTFLEIHPNGRYLYAVSEIERFDGQDAGSLSAYAINRETGKLTFINATSTLGTGPCHLSIDAASRFVLVANYNSGSVCVIPIAENGGVGAATDFIQHEGSGIDPERQEGPHAHAIVLDRANQYVFVNDLGLDKVMIYRFDRAEGKLTPNDPPSAPLRPGAGPRHFCFSPDERYAYVINELGNSVTAFSYEWEPGTLHEMQDVPTLPEDFDGESSCADIHADPSGRFLYGSNRGHDSIVVYSVDSDNGRLTTVDWTSTGGGWPRNFAIDPSGRFLLAANQNDDNILVFRIDPETGRLEATGHTLEVPNPVCIKLLPVD